jgi:hypothetical protein
VQIDLGRRDAAVAHQVRDIFQREPGPQGFRPEPVPGEVEHQVAREPGSITQAPVSPGEVSEGPGTAPGCSENRPGLPTVDRRLERASEILAEMISCKIWKSARDLETFCEFRGFFFQIASNRAWRDRERKGKMEREGSEDRG